MKHMIKIQILCCLACFCMFLSGCKNQTTSAEASAETQAGAWNQPQNNDKIQCINACYQKYSGTAMIEACKEYDIDINMSQKCPNNPNNPGQYGECIQKYQKLQNECQQKQNQAQGDCITKC